MLQRNPESPRELPPTAEMLRASEASAQQATDKRFEKWLKRRDLKFRIGKGALVAALLFDAHYSLYMGDVRANMIEAANAEPSIEIISEALTPENNDKAIVWLHGFNTYGAAHITKKLGPSYQESIDGQLWSVQYNNAVLNEGLISQKLIQEFEEHDITRVDFVLYSQGGVEGSADARDIIEQTTVNTENITFMHSPSDYEALTEKTKDEIGIAKSLAWIPWIEYSTPFRLGAEAYFYRNEMGRNFAAASGGIITRYTNGNMTDNRFLGSQINLMVDADTPRNIRLYGEHSNTKHMPNLYYVATETDKVVDNEVSYQAICTAAQEAGLNCTVLHVDTRHGDYFVPKAVEEYTRAFSEIAETAIPYTEQEIARLGIRSFEAYQLDNFPAS